MRKNEAEYLVLRLQEGFPTFKLPEASASLYVSQMMKLASPDVGLVAVDELIAAETRFPTVSKIREVYAAVARRPEWQRKLVPPGVEIENRCAYCEGTGFVEVGVEDTIKVGGRPFTYQKPTAPCPYCDRGRAIEFGGTWGEDGYWKGREDEKDELQPVRTDVPLPIEENAKRAKILLDRIARGNSTDGLAPERTIAQIEADPMDEEALRRANVVMDAALSGSGVVKDMP